MASRFRSPPPYAAPHELRLAVGLSVYSTLDFASVRRAFVGDPFPAAPPFEFAILRQGQVELMLRRGSPPARTKPSPYDWDVYLRREGDRFREVFAAFSAQGYCHAAAGADVV